MATMTYSDFMQNDAQQRIGLLARVMAHVAMADGQVTPAELASFHDFATGHFDASEGAVLFEGFRASLGERPDIGALQAELRKAFAPGLDRVDLFCSVLSMLWSNGLQADEIETLDSLGAVLELAPQDVDLLSRGGYPLPEFDFPVNLDRCLHLSRVERSETDADPDLIALDLSGAWVVFSQNHPLRMGTDAAPEAAFRVLPPGAVCTVADFVVDDADLRRLARLQSEELQADLALAPCEGRLRLCVGDDPAALRLAVDGAMIVLEAKAGSAFRLNGQAPGAAVRVVPADVLSFGAEGAITVRQLIDDPAAESWALGTASETGFMYLISTEPGPDVDYLLGGDDCAGFVRVELRQEEGQRGALNLRVAQDAPAASLDGVPLEDCGGSCERAVAERAVLRVGPHRFEIDPALPRVSHSRSSIDRFEVSGLQLWIQNPDDRQTIDFSAQAGELVAIMGASGSGKSTLLRTLLGYDRPRAGSILFNGQDFVANFARCRSILGYVPQDDLLMDTLTVRENLRYAGRIRLPHVPHEELERRIDQVLADINLADRQDLVVGNPVNKILSGGQRKRLNIGIELLADPDLFFLDEPTSGLSSRDSEAIVFLLKRLAKRGKLVFTVIHQPSSTIFRQFDRLLLIDVGGRLAWYGPALEAINHFRAYLGGHQDFCECPACGSVNPEIIFEAIEQRGPRGSAQEERRRYGSDFWHSVFLIKREDFPAETPPPILQGLPPPRPNGPRERGKVFGSTLVRNLVDKLRDRANIVISIGAPLVLGAVMSWMLRGPLEPYRYSANASLERFFFLTVIVFVFFGLMSSVNEVIRDRAMINREKIANFSALRYVMAKWSAFAPFSLIQCLLYTAMATLILQFPVWGPAGLELQPPLPFPVFFAVVCLLVEHAAWALGLLASTFMRSQIVAFNLVPVIIIPQILLGGLFVAYGDLPRVVNRVVPEYAEITFTRWGYEALVAGENLLNPHQAIQPDAVKALRVRMAAEGRAFDYQAVVDAPVRAWREVPAFDLPPAALSAAVFDNLDQRLRTRGAASDADFLAASYPLAGPGKPRRLAEGVGAADRERLRSILMGFNTGWWGSAYAAGDANQGLQDLLLSSWSEDSEADLPGPAGLIADNADFPAKERRVGGVSVGAALWDCGVLAAMAIILNSFSIFRLRRKYA